MINNFIITGDTHSLVDLRIRNILNENQIQDISKTAIIILGDVGLNCLFNRFETNMKKEVSNYSITIYGVRGNHEARPQDIPNMLLKYDQNVHGLVYFEKEFPNIKYFKDGESYSINGYKTLVIGGAYSIDKDFRLIMNYPWFENELLSAEEMEEISNKVKGQSYDLILSHTCPLDWEPTDLFLSGVDQSTVDKSMEIWLNQLKNEIQWKVWCFGHFHADRFERPRVEMFFEDYDSLDNIMQRWETYQKTGTILNNNNKLYAPKFNES